MPAPRQGRRMLRRPQQISSKRLGVRTYLLSQARRVLSQPTSQLGPQATYPFTGLKDVQATEAMLFQDLEGNPIDARSNWLHQIARQGRAVALVRMHQPDRRVTAHALRRDGRLGLQDRVEVVEDRVRWRLGA